MEENFDVDKFAALVKSKESVWNYKSTAYGNKAQRKKEWMSICEAMFDDFATKTNEEKNYIATELHTKWKMLRDGFTRSIKNRKKKHGTDGSKGKLYIYYTQLQFLNDLYENKDTVNASDAESSIPGKQEKSRKRPRKRNPETSSEDDDCPPLGDKQNSNSTKKTCRITNENDFDEDKQFLLSLLSDFKKISNDHKLDAKGDIINVIRHYRSTPFIQTKDSYYSNDIVALATTSTEQPNSCGSSFFENAENSCDELSTDIKFNTHA